MSESSVLRPARDRGHGTRASASFLSNKCEVLVKCHTNGISSRTRDARARTSLLLDGILICTGTRLCRLHRLSLEVPRKTSRHPHLYLPHISCNPEHGVGWLILHVCLPALTRGWCRLRQRYHGTVFRAGRVMRQRRSPHSQVNGRKIDRSDGKPYL
mgnify:CR=1 FL=1